MTLIYQWNFSTRTPEVLLYRVTFTAVQVHVYHTAYMEGFGMHSCQRDKDLDKDTGHDEGCTRYGELRRGFPLDDWCAGYQARWT
jgi:hypothetical protein